jgi:hypothetical protein
MLLITFPMALAFALSLALVANGLAEDLLEGSRARLVPAERLIQDDRLDRAIRLQPVAGMFDLPGAQGGLEILG